MLGITIVLPLCASLRGTARRPGGSAARILATCSTRGSQISRPDLSRSRPLRHGVTEMRNISGNATADDEPLDVELWLAYREGDATAFTALYRRHAPAVLRYAWSMLRDRAAAED